MNIPLPPDKQEQLDAFADAVRTAIKRHHKAGRYVPVRIDGKMRFLGPNGEVSDEDKK